MFMCRSDSYVMGWRQSVEDGADEVTWGSFFVRDPDVQLRAPLPPPRGYQDGVFNHGASLGL